MERYEYQNSGIEWLREIPKHWKIDRIKDHFRGDLLQIGDKELAQYAEVFHYSIPAFDENGSPEFCEGASISSGKKILTGTGIIYSKLNCWKPRVWLFDVRNTDVLSVASTEFIGLRPQHINTIELKFIKYLLSSQEFTNSVKIYLSSVTKSHQRINSETFVTQHIPLPPFAEQKAIAEYLNEACERIDRIISIKEKQLEKIENYFKFRILEATTKGLDRNIKLKPTKSKWVGGVPEHWEIKKIKRLAKVFRGKFTHRPRNDPRFYDGEYPFIQTGNVTNAKKYINSYHQTLNELGLRVSELFPSGTLTMTIAANIADVAILNFDACFPDSIVGFKPDHKLELEYLYYLFLALRQDFLGTAIVTTQMNLNITRIGDIESFIPPKSEQIAIVNYLNALEIKVSNVKKKVESQIETLKSYRKSLIHECVTGKKQVYEGKINIKVYAKQ